MQMGSSMADKAHGSSSTATIFNSRLDDHHSTIPLSPSSTPLPLQTDTAGVSPDGIDSLYHPHLPEDHHQQQQTYALMDVVKSNDDKSLFSKSFTTERVSNDCKISQSKQRGRDDVQKKGSDDEKKMNQLEGKEMNGSQRERLKRHRREMGGNVWIPEMWGQEDFLKDWIDCTAFDASLVPANLMLARSSLMEEGRRANSSSFTVENSC